MKRWARWMIGIAAAGVILIVSAVLYVRFYEPDRAIYPLRGIDVSHHQGAIDWAKVAQNDVAFAYIKASEGGDHRDTRFAVNWREARAAGLEIGAYHFFTFCRSGREQAANFIAALGQDVGTLPPALDLEFGGNCSKQPGQAAIKAEIVDFITAVEQHVGKPVVLYVTPEFLAAYGRILPNRSLWIRSLFHHPDRRQDWAFWQYHNAGYVDGITGRVDLNVFREDRATLRD